LVENVKQYNGWYLQDGDLIPAEDQDDHEPARFLKKRHFFTQAGVIISPHEKYADELVRVDACSTGNPKQLPMSVERSLCRRSWMRKGLSLSYGYTSVPQPGQN
jgi:hypothetical protein